MVKTWPKVILGITVVGAALLVGGQDRPAQSPAGVDTHWGLDPQQPYELKHETTQISSRMLDFQTRYTFGGHFRFKEFLRSKSELKLQWKELWTMTKPGKHAHHWIDQESGQVWIATGRLMTSEPNVFVYRRDGTEVQSWATGAYAMRGRAGSSVPKVTEGQLVNFHNGRVKQLRIPYEGGGEMHLTLFEDNQRVKAVQDFIPAGEPNPFERALIGKDYDRPIMHKRSGNMAFWSVHGTNGKDALYWVQTLEPWTSEGSFLIVRTQRVLPSLPERALPTPRGAMVTLTFGSGNERSAVLRVLDKDGNEAHVLDVQQAGNYQSLEEATRLLDGADIRVLTETKGWLPIAEAPIGSSQQPEQISIKDEADRVFQLTLADKGAKLEVSHKARRGMEGSAPKEPTWETEKPLSQSFVQSANGKFRVRIRTYPGRYSSKLMGYTTLLANVTDYKGESAEVELWSNVFYDTPPTSAFVTNSGRTYLLESRGSSPPSVLMAWNPDGSQLAGINLNEGWQKTADRSDLRPGQIAATYVGEPEWLSVEGVPVPFYSKEILRIKVDDQHLVTFDVTGTPGKVHHSQTHPNKKKT